MMEPIEVLIVDDDPFFRRGLQAALEAPAARRYGSSASPLTPRPPWSWSPPTRQMSRSWILSFSLRRAPSRRV